MSPEDGSVYFIEAAGSGLIKIGWAKDVYKRLATLQTGSSKELAIRAIIPGDRALEKELHDRFAEGRELGEWFKKSTPGLKDLMQQFRVSAPTLRTALVDRLKDPAAFLSRSDLRVLGLERRAIDAVFRACPVVFLPGYTRPLSARGSRSPEARPT